MSSSKKSSPPAKVSGPEAPGSAPAPRPDAVPASEPPRESPRDTIESVVGAFLLAFLFRTFQAEAFVIPTGSMAPTLYGEQRDVFCEKCGTRFAVGADSVPSPQAELRYDQTPTRSSFLGRLFPQATIDPNQRLHSAICPNSGCQYVNSVLDRQIFAGDRILVNKFPYEFAEPRRWDVVVFRFPEKPKTNYIKRLVGLPGEQVRVIRGDVWYRAAGSDEAWKIARKSPERQIKIQLPVHDNDRPARDLLAAGWPESWAPEARSAAPAAGEPGTGKPGTGEPGGDDPGATRTGPAKAGSSWQADAERRTFRVDPAAGGDGDWQWLRYSHYVPRASDWNRVRKGLPATAPRPEPVQDFYAYNAKVTVAQASFAARADELPTPNASDLAQHWVGDLTLSGTVTVEQARGELLFELVRGTRRYRCEIDLATGRGQFLFPAELAQDSSDVVVLGAEFDSGLRAGREQRVRFSDVDNRLILWVDDTIRQTIDLDRETDAPFQAVPPEQVEVTEQDRRPVAIAARNASVRVGHLLIERDIYYTPGKRDEFVLADSEQDADDEFLMFGDNSPRSHDGRYWDDGPAVPRRLLVGKAFCIYWPHAMPFLNDGRGFAVSNYKEPNQGGKNAGVSLPRFTLPFYPQIQRMRRVF